MGLSANKKTLEPAKIPGLKTTIQSARGTLTGLELIAKNVELKAQLRKSLTDNGVSPIDQIAILKSIEPGLEL